MKINKKVALFSLAATPALVIVAEDIKVNAADNVTEASALVINETVGESTFATLSAIEKARLYNSTEMIVVNSEGEFKTALQAKMAAYETNFVIQLNKGDSFELYKKVLNEILDENDYIKGTYSGLRVSGQLTETTTTFTFTISYLTNAQQEAEVDKQVKQIISEIVKPGMSQVDQVKAINDYIALKTTYSFDTVASSHAAYAILSEGKGVCQAYALLAYKLLKEAGFEVRYVTGNAGGPHAWNKVKVDEEWYNLDITWNDPTGTGNPSYVQYKYFLISDNQIKDDHTEDNNNYPSATSERFANVRGIATPVQIGSKLYYPVSEDRSLYMVDLNASAVTPTKVNTTVYPEYLTYTDVDGYLYFSDYNNGGYLTRMKPDGTELTQLGSELVTKITISDKQLVAMLSNGSSQVINLGNIDQDAANTVIALISKLNPNSSQFATDVASARGAYNGLTSEQRGLVTNVADLVKAETVASALTTVVSSSDVAQVIIAIATLTEDPTVVKNARTRYDQLSTADTALVTNYQNLLNFEALIQQNTAAANKVINLINEIGIASDSELYAKVKAARTEYDKLTPSQQLLVTPNVITITKYEDVVKKDEEAVYSVNYAIGLLNESDPKFVDNVTAARAAYNALTARQKMLANVAVLEGKEAVLNTAKNVATAVDSAISNLTATSTAAQIQLVRQSYNGLNELAKSFVTKLSTLTTLESALNTSTGDNTSTGGNTSTSDNTSTGGNTSTSDNTSTGGNTSTSDNTSTGDNTSTSDNTGNGDKSSVTSGSEQKNTEEKVIDGVSKIEDNNRLVVQVKPSELNTSEEKVVVSSSNGVEIAIPTEVLNAIGGTVAIDLQVADDSQVTISFNAEGNSGKVIFSDYIEVAIPQEMIPGDVQDVVMLRVAENGEYIATPFVKQGDMIVLKTKGAGQFIFSTENVSFSDVQQDGHKEYIEALAKRHIIKGTSKESYNPNQQITRAQFSVLMARALGLDTESNAKFDDVQGKWYEKEVQSLVELGVIKGVNSSEFASEQSLTRQQSAIMIYRLLNLLNVDTSAYETVEAKSFKDIDKIQDAETRQSILLMQKLGIFSGYSDGTFDPNGKLTRSQMAKVLYKTLELAKML